MEHTNEIKEDKNDKKNLAISVAFIVAIFLMCFLLVLTIIVLLKNIEEIKTDPILYGMEKSGYNMCGCSGDNIDGHIYTIGVPAIINSNELNYQVTNGAG